MNFFTLLDLPIEIPVDKQRLNAHYQQLQRQCHPDNFANASPGEQREAVQQSALINDAYQQLKHPLRSIEYFLSLQGVDVYSQHTVQDTDFLMAQLDLRETLDNIINMADSADREAKFDAFSQEVNAQFNHNFDVLYAQIQAKNWPNAGEWVVKLQFFEKLKQQIDAFEEQLY